MPVNTGSGTSAVTLQDTPPYASFSSSTTSTLVGNTVSFNATNSYDPDGTLVSYSWKFGDGGTSIGVTTSHVFNTAGSFNVTLTVTDNSGSTGTYWTVIVVSTWPTTTIVNCSPLIVSSGQSTSCTATVTDTSPNGPTPSGTITFSPNGICTLSGTGSTATCTAIVSPTSSGTVSVSASYSGDAYHTANNGTVSLTVQPASGNGALPLYYFGILAAIIGALLVGLFLAFRRHKVTHTKLKIDLEAVKSEAGRIENQEFFQSVKDQLKKDKETSA
jgi:PKD repeat protein